MREFFRHSSRVLAVTLAVLVFVLSVTPDTEDLEGATDIFAKVMDWLFGQPDMGDKLAHLCAYGALATAAVMGFVRTTRSFFVAFVLILVFGAALEVIQGLGGVRTTDSFDLIANLGGVAGGMALGGAFVYLVHKWYPAS